MIKTQELTLKRLYIASDNYHEIFFDGIIKPKYQYKECRLIERVINKEKHKNIYVLEPNKIYKCQMNELSNPQWYFYNFQLNTYIAQAGVIFLDMNKDNVYLKNNGTNPVYIKKNTIIAVCKFIDRLE